MNSLELILNQLVHEKNVLEFELERVINQKDIETNLKMSMSKEILSKLTNTINMINLTSTYLKPVNNELEQNNN